MNEYSQSILESARELAEEKIIELKDFMCEQIDEYLRKKTVEWKAAVLLCDTAAMEHIRRNAHRLVDAALDYKAAELLD